jgi:hypothetical protein
MKRFVKILSIVCCLLVLIAPVQAHAFIDLSFDILSFGPFSIGASIPLRGAAGLLGAFVLAGAVISFFSGGSSASYSGPAGPVITNVRVTIKADDHYERGPMRIKFSDIIKDDKIPLPMGGYLEIQEDGKMVFTGVDFLGYAYLHYDRAMTVWNDRDELMVALAIRDGRLMII